METPNEIGDGERNMTMEFCLFRFTVQTALTRERIFSYTVAAQQST